MKASRRQLTTSLAAALFCPTIISPVLARQAVYNADGDDDEKLRTEVFPKELGAGLLSTSNEILGIVLDMRGRARVRKIDAQPFFGVKLIDKRSAFSVEIFGSGQASARFAGGGAAAAASMSKSIRQSEVQSSLLVHKTVITKEYYARRAAWLEEARQAAKNSHRFLQMFGDKAIDSVMVGGKMAILFTFTFASREEAETFSASVQGNYGALKASGNFQRNLFRLAQNSTLNATGFILGVPDAPQITINNVKIDRRGRVVTPDPNIKSVLDFFNTFDVNKVRAAGGEFPVQLNVTRSDAFPNSVPLPDLTHERLLIRQAEAIRDVIERRLSETEFLENTALNWNQQIHKDDVNQLEMNLQALRERAEQNITDLAELRAKAVAIKDNEVPPLPATAWLSVLQSRGPYKFRIANNHAQVSGFRDVVLPQIDSKRPCKFSVNHEIHALRGSVRVEMLDKDQKLLGVLFRQDFVGPSRNVDKTHKTTTHFAMLSPNSVFLRVSADVDHGNFSIGGIVRA